MKHNLFCESIRFKILILLIDNSRWSLRRTFCLHLFFLIFFFFVSILINFVPLEVCWGPSPLVENHWTRIKEENRSTIQIKSSLRTNQLLTKTKAGYKHLVPDSLSKLYPSQFSSIQISVIYLFQLNSHCA